ncbi:MAG: hypothetical protein ACM3X3_00745 [Betaproteobacteria bacterium]
MVETREAMVLALSLEDSNPGMRRLIVVREGGNGLEVHERRVSRDSDPLRRQREEARVVCKRHDDPLWGELEDIFRDAPAALSPEAKGNA